MKKWLYIAAIGTLGGSFYLYVKKQLELALSYDYKIKTFKILTLNTKEASIEFVIKLINRSAFKIEVLSYDLNVYYQDINIGRTFSTEYTVIEPNSSTDVKTTAEIVFSEVKKSVGPLISNILTKKPIDISIDGYVKVKFMAFNHTIKFNRDKFQYSADILKDYGLDDDLEKLKAKFKF